MGKGKKNKEEDKEKKERKKEKQAAKKRDRKEHKRKKKCKKNADGEKFTNHGIQLESPEMRNDQPQEAPKIYVPSGLPLPPRVDLRRWCSPVENQRKTNSCCANAVVGALEYLIWREAAIKNDSTPDDLSRLFVYYNGRKRDKAKHKILVGMFDRGMTIEAAIDAVKHKGACLEKTWPYKPKKVNKKPSDKAEKEARSWKISSSQKIPLDLDAMRSCLAEGLPIIFGLKLTKRFFSVKSSGLIVTPNLSDSQAAEHGLHAMLIVGYSDREEKFIVRNSWGKKWGDDGYCYVPYSYITNPAFNILSQYAILAVNDIDLAVGPQDDSTPLITGAEVEADDSGVVDSEEEEESEDENDSDSDDDSEDDMDVTDSLGEAQRVFDQVDADHTGNISTSELKKALKLNGTKVSDSELQKLMQKYDADNSGKLSFVEFCRVPGVLPSGKLEAAEFGGPDAEAGSSRESSCVCTIS